MDNIPIANGTLAVVEVDGHAMIIEHKNGRWFTIGTNQDISTFANVKVVSQHHE